MNERKDKNSMDSDDLNSTQVYKIIFLLDGQNLHIPNDK